MKAFVFVGFLAYLSFAHADSKFNTTAEEVREILQEIDPATVSSLSMTVFDRIKVNMTSFSISGFSKFAFPVLSDDGSNVKSTFQLSSLAANLNNLYADHGTGLIGRIPQFDASVGGINIELNASYTTSPLRLTTLSSLLQLSSISASGTRVVNDHSANITVGGSDLVEGFNSKATELQEQISATLLSVVNSILSIIYP